MIRRPPRSTQRRSSAASDVYKRQMPGIKLVEKPSACHRQDPDEGPEPNARAQAEMSQAKVGPSSGKSAPDDWEHQKTCIRFACSPLKPQPGVIEGQESHGEGMQLQHESGQACIHFARSPPRNAAAIVLVQHAPAAHRTGHDAPQRRGQTVTGDIFAAAANSSRQHAFDCTRLKWGRSHSTERASPNGT